LPKISGEYLPPKDALPEKIYAIPEVRYPRKLNLAEARASDAHVVFNNVV